MRFASEGPIRGRRSSDSVGAVSRSTGEVVKDVEVVEVIEGTAPSRFLDTFDDLDDLETLCALAESTSSICRWSAGWETGPGAVARRRRTPAPRRATEAKKRSAWRSEGVTGNEASSPAGSLFRPGRASSFRFSCHRDLTDGGTGRTLSVTRTRGHWAQDGRSRRSL